ncbi:MAG: AAA family ATPase [Bacteroidales bacterium]
MERLITKKLQEWKAKSGRKPLLVRGARQTGKSYSITDFGRTHFVGEFHILNLEKNPEYHSIFKQNLDAQRIVFEIELIVNKKIHPGKTLLFIDEIQACPNAIAALRYFYEQMPELHVIAAGSLLEFALKDISFPVGRIQMMELGPMNFYEYLNAGGKVMMAETIIKEPIKLSDTSHQLLLDELRNYFLIGGMPECVKTYIETGSINEVFQIQTDLLATFRQDFSKYALHSKRECLNHVLTAVSQKTGQQIKYTQLSDDFSGPTIKKAFELLETARLFKKVKVASPAGIPIGASATDSKFKAVFLDIGLLSRLSGLTAYPGFNNQNFSGIFKGALSEQFVGQELISAGHHEIYYWARDAKNSNAEIDYLAEKEGQIIPVEVKSGAAGSLKSLHLLLQTYKNIEKAFVFSDNHLARLDEQKLIFYPLYYAFNVLNINM